MWAIPRPEQPARRDRHYWAPTTPDWGVSIVVWWLVLLADAFVWGVAVMYQHHRCPNNDVGPGAFIVMTSIFLLLPTIYGIWRAAIHINHDSHRVLAWAMAIVIGVAGAAAIVTDVVVSTRDATRTRCEFYVGD